MATLYIAEYTTIASVSSALGATDAPTQAPQEPPIAEGTVAIQASPTTYGPFNRNTRIIRVHADTICSIAVGVSPTATTSTKRLAANQTEFFGVLQGQSLSVIQNV